MLRELVIFAVLDYIRLFEIFAIGFYDEVFHCCYYARNDGEGKAEYIKSAVRREVERIQSEDEIQQHSVDCVQKRVVKTEIVNRLSRPFCEKFDDFPTDSESCGQRTTEKKSARFHS